MMITITISINTHVLYARTAVNITEEKGGKYATGMQFYKLDTGSIIEHPYGDIKGLVKKMVESIEIV